MNTCSIHGCPDTAGWRQEGKDYCRAHALEAAIRTGRPMTLVCPMEADDQAVDATDPVSVWDELTAGWESMAIDDHNAVEQLVVCCLEQGKSQAMELARLRGGATS